MRKMILTVVMSLAFGVLNAATPTDNDVTALVDQTAADIAANAPDTFMKIFKASEPYINKENPELMAYVLTSEGKIEVHPKVGPTGQLVKNMEDSKGKKYYEEVLKKAEKLDATGWETYTVMKPDGTTFERKVYYKVVNGSNNKKYIVCSEKNVEK